MMKTALRNALLALILVPGARAASGGVVVIGHPSLAGKVDESTVQKIFTGKVIEVGGVSVTAVNAHLGSPVRNQVGELVIRQPWIGMTRGFWKDPER